MSALVSYWKMDEGTGTTLNDSSGHGNTATISGSETWTANIIKSGVTSPVWGGGRATASSALLTNFNGTTPFSIAVWMESTAGGGPAKALVTDVDPSSNSIGWELGVNPGSIGFYFSLANNVGSGNFLKVSNGTIVNSGAVHLLIATYDGSKTAAGASLYIDGSGGPGGVITDALTGSTASGLAVSIGSRGDGSATFLGASGYPQIYDFVLTSGQIAALAAGGPGTVITPAPPAIQQFLL